jgi:hypothetical protein
MRLLIAACLPPGSKPLFIMDRGYARAPSSGSCAR